MGARHSTIGGGTVRFGTENRASAPADPRAALVAARVLIAEEEHWTRTAPARRLRPARGRARNRHEAEWLPSHATDPRAGRWCAAGALCAVSGMRSGAPGIAYLEVASRQLFGTGIGRANDDAPLTTHADILRCFDLAITLAEAAGKRTSPQS